MNLYITDSTSKIGINNGKISVDFSDEHKEYPFNIVDSISIFGKPYLSTSLIQTCIKEKINVYFYSIDGHYFGHISNDELFDVERQKKQILLTDDKKFCIELSKKIQTQKIRNQIFLLKSFKKIYEYNDSEISEMKNAIKNIKSANQVEEIMGYEGSAAHCYFQNLYKIIKNSDFHFTSRTTQPPKDAFNSMISYGYSLLYKNIVGAIKRHSLNPYFGFCHFVKKSHAALASDLIEEYRAMLVDKTVIELINNNEIEVSMFEKSNGGVYGNFECVKLLTNKFSDIIVINEKYFSNLEKEYSFQTALDMQIISLVNAIEHNNVDEYQNIIWNEK